jgi:hypothetical protein
LENVTTNGTLKQPKSIEMSKDLVLNLEIYHIFEKKKAGREESPHFLERKKGEEHTKDGTEPLSSTTPMRPWVTCGTGTSSSSSGTVTAGPYGIGTSSSSSRTAIAWPYDSRTSFSSMCMHFALVTISSQRARCQIVLSSSLMSSTKTEIYPNLTTNILILEREVPAFLRKKEG